MGEVQKPVTYRQQEFFVPSKIKNISDKTKKTLLNGKWGTTILTNPFTKEGQIFQKTKTGRLVEFSAEELKTRRDDRSKQYVIDTGETKLFYENGKQVPSLFNRVSNWTFLGLLGLLGLSYFLPRAEGATYSPQGPEFQINTQSFGSNFPACDFLNIGNDTHAMWINAGQACEGIVPFGESAMAQSNVTSTLFPKEQAQMMQASNGEPIKFWQEIDTSCGGTRIAWRKGSDTIQYIDVSCSARQFSFSVTELPNHYIISYEDRLGHPTWRAKIIKVDKTTLQAIGIPEQILSLGTMQRDPSVFPRNSGGFVLIASVDGDIYQQLYDADGEREGSFTKISTTTTSATLKLNSPIGSPLPNNGYIAAWLSTNQNNASEILNVEYILFNEDGTPRSLVQNFPSGSSGNYNFNGEMIRFTKNPEGGVDLLFPQDGKIKKQSFFQDGLKSGDPEPFGGNNIASFSARYIPPNEMETVHTNASGVFGQLWSTDFIPTTIPPTTTPPLSPTSTPTTVSPTEKSQKNKDSSPAGAIAGGIIGSLFSLISSIFACYVYRNRRGPVKKSAKDIAFEEEARRSIEKGKEESARRSIEEKITGSSTQKPNIPMELLVEEGENDEYTIKLGELLKSSDKEKENNIIISHSESPKYTKSKSNLDDDGISANQYKIDTLQDDIDTLILKISNDSEGSKLRKTIIRNLSEITSILDLCLQDLGDIQTSWSNDTKLALVPKIGIRKNDVNKLSENLDTYFEKLKKQDFSHQLFDICLKQQKTVGEKLRQIVAMVDSEKNS